MKPTETFFRDLATDPDLVVDLATDPDLVVDLATDPFSHHFAKSETGPWPRFAIGLVR